MKKIIFVFTIIVFLAFVGYGLSKADLFHNPDPRMVKSEIQDIGIVSCKDTDYNDIYEAGVVTYYGFNEETGRIEETGSIGDFCDPIVSTEEKEDVVRESYCSEDNTKVVNEYWTCGDDAVCRQGRCIAGGQDLPRCVDSDGGINPEQKGTVDINGIVVEDSCWSYESPQLKQAGSLTNQCSGSNCYTYEYYCNDFDNRDYKIIPAVNGCSE